jgi:hypothetical protein
VSHRPFFAHQASKTWLLLLLLLLLLLDQNLPKSVMSASAL